MMSQNSGKSDEAEEVNKELNNPTSDNPDIDGGWAWVIMIGAASWNALISGSLKSFGLIYLEYLELFQQGAVATGLIGSVFALFITILAPISGYMSDQLSLYSLRRVVMIGGVVLSGGMAATVWAPSLPFAILSYGVVAGVAAAFVDSPVLSLIAKFFRKRRFLASGVAFAGSSVGTLVLPSLITLLIHVYGIRGAMLVLAALWLHTCAIGAAIRPVVLRKHRDVDQHAWDVNTNGTIDDPAISFSPSVTDLKQSSISIADHQMTSKASRPVIMEIEVGLSTTTKQTCEGNAAKTVHPPISSSSSSDVQSHAGHQEPHSLALDGSGTHAMCDISTFAQPVNKIRTMSVDPGNEDDVQSVLLGGTEDEESVQKNRGGCKRRALLCQDYRAFLQTPGLPSLIFTFIFASFAYYNMFFLFPPLAQELGFSKLVGSLLVSVPNVSELVSRIGAGQLIDRGLINKTKLLYSSFVLSFVLGVAVSFSTHAWVFIAFAAVFGLLSGIFVIMMIPMMVEVVAVDKMGSASGLFPFLTGIGIFLGPPVLAAVREATGSWMSSLRLCMSSYVGAVVCLLIHNSRHMDRCSRRRR